MWIIQVLVGIVIGFISIFYCAQIIYPIFYFIPKSIGLVVTGKLRPFSILRCFFAPLIFIAIPLLFGFFYPSFVDTKLFQFLNNTISGLIANIMVIGMVASSVFTKKGRDDLKADFWSTMDRYRKYPYKNKLELESYGALLHFEEGLKMYDSQNYSGSIEKYNIAVAVLESTKSTVIENTELLKEAYYNRGCAKDELKDYIGAINDYTKSINLGNADAASYSNRALARYELNDFDEAINDYSKAVKLEPNNATAFLGMANAKYKQGDKIGACSDWRRAEELGNEHAAEMISTYCT